MPGNAEEKEKCLEKLNQMQKYLPFLDFMIDKIKKKNSEISLECQLSKFQLLRSMIAEKSGKYTWDVIVKVEDVIEKLISKLDFKDPYEKSKQFPPKTDSPTCKTNMATSVSIVPSSTAVSVATSASSRTTTVDSKPQDSSANVVDLIMKTLKVSVDNKNTEKDKEILSNALGSIRSTDVCGKTMETDLDKDLDGFDLTDCSGLSGTEPKNAETVPPVSEKPSFHNDLLSSSREKLLKSLQSRLFPGGIPPPLTSSHVNKNEKAGESQSSALNNSQVNIGERKTKNEVLENSEHSAVDRNNKKDVSAKTSDKKGLAVSKSFKSSDKSRTDSTNISSDVNLKQRLKEKLSTDICEVYRVPGKSVGGSLRSLKDFKDQKKNFTAEEEKLFTPDIPTHIRLSTEKKDNLGDKSHRDSTQSERKRSRSLDQSSYKHGSSSSGNKISDEKNSKTTTQKEVKNLEKESSKEEKQSPEISIEKHFELSKLNDSELLGFVKENVKSFPHLGKMKLPELKQAVQTSLVCKLAGIDTDAISEISDDSFQDSDETLGGKSSNHSKSDCKSESKRMNSDPKLGGADDISDDENLDDEEYALKLIEDTTPKTYPPKKKKGLLELPMPITDDLFDDISSIESFESFRSPIESKDPRLKKIMETKKLPENKPEPNLELNKTIKEVSTTNRAIPQLPNSTSHSSKPQTDKPRSSQEKPWKQDHYTAELTPVRNISSYSKPSFCNNDPRRHSQSLSEARSYAEYKRRKLKEQEKARNASLVSRLSTEKEDSGRNNLQDPRRRDSCSKQTNLNNYSSSRARENRKSRPHSKFKPEKEKTNYQEESKKEENDRAKKSVESEELVSPLEELYRNESKPKTGRGYGLQNFKIPRKGAQGSRPKKNQNSNPVKTNEKIKNDSKKETKEVKEIEKEKEEISQVHIVESTKGKDSGKSDSTQVDSNVPCKSDEKVESSESSPKTVKTEHIVIEVEDESSSIADSSENSTNTKDTIVTNPEPESVTVTADAVANPKSEVDSNIPKTDAQQMPNAITDTSEQVVTNKESKTVEDTMKKAEAQIVECDSSVETPLPNDQISGKDSASPVDKNTVISKEEITQEFVEALIRKSFQSGEGKLLLAQVKLFEKFARKLNSKKLKTIQKIINSESDSSSSTSETSSEDEKKKKKLKKYEERSQKSKKRRKKGKSRRKKKTSSSSSSSSSESEESSEEENCDKKEEKSENKKNENVVGRAGSEENKVSEASEEFKQKSNEFSGILKTKGKKRRRCSEFGRNFSGSRAKRKQKQKKLLEQILNEGPQPEASNDSNTENTCEAPEKKESERKNKQKKTKIKTELDRLHDDIRSMFISEGVLTATGQRMCRILKQSGGNMNNLDIVKESAKMVEEEKLRKVQTRTSARNPRSANIGNGENRSRSQSLDKTKTRDIQQENEEEDPKLTIEPQVALQRVNLDNFGYGVKISDDCISFRRMKGGNTAIKRTKISESTPVSENHMESILAKNVFLARNKRKFERLRDSEKKKIYGGKKLMEVVKNLPLKMAKMKHLQIGEKKEDEETEKRKNSNEESDVHENKTKLTNMELLRYAFDKKREMYFCKLCTCITRNIAGHYRSSHPESEVLISRLNVQEARRAILEAKRSGYDDPKDEQPSLAESMTQKVKALLRRGITFNCRMCHHNKIIDMNTFASHVSTHTGEYRFKCPSQNCSVYKTSNDDIKFHILTKHSKYRSELYSKITELYELTFDEGILFGFICSKCHFVQICRKNLENHILNQHKNSEDVKIIKINMSGRKTRPFKNKNVKGELTNSELNKKSEKSEIVTKVEKPPSANTQGNDEKETNKRKRMSEDEVETELKVEQNEKKKLFLNETSEIFEADNKSGNGSQELIDEEEVDVEDNESIEDDVCGALEIEDCADLKNISELKGSDIIKSMENLCRREYQIESDLQVVEPCRKLKVGPLEAQLLENSGVLYECYVKGCLFSTRVYDLFQKHIKISHWKTKWNGICEICASKNDSKPRETALKLLTALKHLKLHERETLNQRKTTDNVVMELKPVNSSADIFLDGRDSGKLGTDFKSTTKVTEGDETRAAENTPETSYPAKPLLRVRNFLGDRLSTPKADENVVAITEEDSNTSEPTANSTMFTIENVRSLTEASTDESGLKIEQVCSLKEHQGTQLGSEKTIIVRSCPTRTITIRPKPSSLPVDVGHINVQPPTVNHPVVLSPISNNSPIRIVSTSAKSKYAVKPIVVSTDSVCLNTSVMPVIRPVMSPTTGLPVTGGTETKNNSHKTQPEGNNGITQMKSSLEVERITSPNKSPSGSSPGTFHLGKNSSPDHEEMEKKDTLGPQRIHSGLGSGKKSVKDAKIYQEMLTKTKLCHLFKCMGIECSFTCNNDNVFTQHIGLHEAQRRLERSKGMKTFRLANKTTEAFPWQQCAYCCEVLSNTSSALSQHVLDEHGHCMYQCAFCFYRAISHSYVEIHQNLAHSHVLKTTPRLIYKCRPLKVAPSRSSVLEKHGRRQSVRPYHCDQCGRNFFITHEFTNHLATEHQSVTAYTCHICKNLCFKVKRLINHYRLHSYSTYQCAYCLHGTETEKEMVFHLSNFHFSQPAVMYVRVLAEGQSGEEKQKPNKKKKSLSNQLDSLKVIVYESDTLNADCVVEVEPEEEITESISPSATDLSSIVAELGISTDPESSSSTGVTPLMQELASINDKTAKNLTVKTLLPNAQFSSENESGIENCSVLISSGLSIPSDQNDEKEMNIPLGQLPLEAVYVQHKEATPRAASPDVVSPPDKNLKLNEIIVNRYCKSLASTEEEKIGPPAVILSSAVHKLPPVVLTRTSACPSKCTVRKKSEEQVQNEIIEGDKEQVANHKLGCSIKENTAGDKVHFNGGNVEKVNASPRKSSIEKDSDSGDAKSGKDPLITNIVSLSNNRYDKEEPTEEASLFISKICSLTSPPKDTKDSSQPVVINIKSAMNCSTTLKPPIIRVEDFPIDENITSKSSLPSENPPKIDESTEVEKNESEKMEDERPSSPDVIILEDQKARDIVTVTLDSDEEKDESLKKKTREESKEASEPVVKDITIRKEMELLRKQIANETDSLLNDEVETIKPPQDLTLDMEPNTVEEPVEKTLLSPIEEAICSLNKKLQSETEEAQKKEEEEKKEKEESSKTPDGNIVLERPRTRFGARDRKKEGGDGLEKSEGDENKKDDARKGKKFKQELSGKNLFICGNEKCNFAGDDDVSLKDHLYVCDLSRESSVLICPHCSRQIKQFHPYLEHLRYHGEKKFHCGLCSFSSAVDTSTSRHVKQKHKCSIVKILPKESKEGHLVYYPKNYKVDKVDFEVNGYSPGDEDKLPLQSVYQVNVKCAKCPYFTKVRSNMVRHLKIHLKSVETEGVVVVPSTAPTNPVPCLETKERMFDKMTNLAASSQLAQAKEKTTVESLSPEEEAKLPQFITEQMRYKCCLPDCNYITIDEGMLRHHIKALHDEINYYSCPHCKETVHADVRHVTLDKIGHHLKHHDSKLYKCAHCIYFHYQKNVVEKHTAEKHPDRRYFVHTVREPKPEIPPEEESSSSNDGGARVWKCALCDEFRTPSKPTLMDHLLKNHNTKSKYKCQFCTMKGNNYQAFAGHFSSKHPGEKVSYARVYHSEKVAFLESGNSSGADSSNEHFDTTPLWQRGAPRIRHIRGILIEEEEIKTKKSKRISLDESEAETSHVVKVKENAFYCPLCTNKKKPFYTRNEDCFRTHLYQELNYQQFACILCGKMFVDKKDFEKHHARVHTDKPQALKQTKEDHEIKFWVDQVIAKRKKQMEERKRKLSDQAASESQVPPKKKKEV